MEYGLGQAIGNTTTEAQFLTAIFGKLLGSKGALWLANGNKLLDTILLFSRGSLAWGKQICILCSCQRYGLGVVQGRQSKTPLSHLDLRREEDLA